MILTKRLRDEVTNRLKSCLTNLSVANVLVDVNQLKSRCYNLNTED